MNRSYVVHEAAILFESGFNLFFEKTVVVVAPPQICIQRVVTRDGVTPGEVLKRMNNQWDPELKAARADYILINDGNHMLLQQILALNKELSKLPATL
jgi:dephospho-CoA kinase